MKAHLAPGALLSDRYRLTNLLGRGGMGEVWEATHDFLPRKTAVKLIKSSKINKNDMKMKMRMKMKMTIFSSHA